MSLLDVFTGGKDQAAEDAMNKAEQVYAGLNVPTAAQLTLPELQKFVSAGLMTPAQAEAALVSGNAFDSISTDPSTRQAQQKALNSLQAIGDSNGSTPETRAALTDALDQVKTQEQGAQGSILDSLAARGIPTSLMEGALRSANAGQQSESANKAATDAAADQARNAMAALESAGTMSGQMHAQDYSEAANKAAAANAINQWNAQNKTGVNVSNASNKQAANAYNAENAQDVSNKNTATGNARTEYNAQVPETVFQNAATKAAGQSGAFQNIGDLEQKQGQQNAGIMSGLINLGTSFIPKPAPTVPGHAHGTVVPGRPNVPGDSPANDKVPAMLSPGEVVVPRSIAPHPEAVKNFVAHLMRGRAPKPVHHEDVRSVLDALSQRREASNGM